METVSWLRPISTVLMLITIALWVLSVALRRRGYRKGVRYVLALLVVASVLLILSQIWMFHAGKHDRDLIIAAMFAIITWFNIRALHSLRQPS